MDWISVKDELPGEHQVVIIYWLQGGVTGTWAMPTYSSFGGFHDDALAVKYENVTHWMPLPEPPTS